MDLFTYILESLGSTGDSSAFITVWTSMKVTTGHIHALYRALLMLVPSRQDQSIIVGFTTFHIG